MGCHVGHKPFNQQQCCWCPTASRSSARLISPHAVRAQVEPSFASQLWRGVRFCLSLLLGITVLSVVFEEKGLGRGMLNNPDHRPEQVSNVRFTDVKGVDEAKVQAFLTARNTSLQRSLVCVLCFFVDSERSGWGLEAVLA